jgi:hypothetical protein
MNKTEKQAGGTYSPIFIRVGDKGKGEEGLRILSGH